MKSLSDIATNIEKYELVVTIVVGTLLQIVLFCSLDELNIVSMLFIQCACYISAISFIIPGVVKILRALDSHDKS